MALGRKTGGRKPGSVNKTTAQRQAEIAAGGILPLDYMLKVLRDNKEKPERKAWAAAAAAPYVHPKLANIEVGQKDGKAWIVALPDIASKL